jgi:hypothetical protein
MKLSRCCLFFFCFVGSLISSLQIAKPDEAGTIGHLRNQCLEAERMVKDDDYDDKYSVGYCLGFMAGVGVVLQFNCFDKDYQGKFATMSSTNAQCVRAFINWSDDHPEHWGRREEFAVDAFIEKLPCSK